MKANAPEKIYIDDFGTELSHDWHTEHSYETSIEYTRTDAFIEKVYDWLKNYAFLDDNKNVNLPILLHDFLKDSRTF